jgi:hypothetical protein
MAEASTEDIMAESIVLAVDICDETIEESIIAEDGIADEREELSLLEDCASAPVISTAVSAAPVVNGRIMEFS